MFQMTDKASAPGERPRRRRPTAEARRLDILRAAREVFLEAGYEAGSMSEVARRLGGSKETLYRYFRSKQALFTAVVREGAAEHARDIFNGFAESADLACDLAWFGRALLTFATCEGHLALRRALIAEAGRSDVGKLYFAQAGAAWKPLAARLAKAMDQGRLRRAHPWTAAMHFRGLCLSDLQDMRLEGVIKPPSPQEIAGAVDDAVDVFLRGYAPEAASVSACTQERAGAKEIEPGCAVESSSRRSAPPRNSPA